jgi:glyoxylase-like metal-dependent hydrolase (beta-lactamase superfamily II)
MEDEMKKVIIWISGIIGVVVITSVIVFYPFIQGALFLTELKLDDHISVFPSMMSGNSMAITSIDNDTVIIIDTKQGRDAEKLYKKIHRRSPNSAITIICTHSHYDHTGGNRLYKNPFLITGNYSNEQWSREADTIKYPDCKLLQGSDTSIAINDECLQIKALHSAHTSGDLIVFFKKHRILCTGDNVFDGMHPVVFEKIGSNIHGWIDNMDTLTALCPIKVIPGHGDIGTSTLITNQKRYFITIRDALRDQKQLTILREKYKKLYSLPGFSGFDITVNFMRKEYE